MYNQNKREKELEVFFFRKRGDILQVDEHGKFKIDDKVVD